MGCKKAMLFFLLSTNRKEQFSLKKSFQIIHLDSHKLCPLSQSIFKLSFSHFFFHTGSWPTHQVVLEDWLNSKQYKDGALI